MGAVGSCFDNAAAESWFATLECELLTGRTFATRAEARAAIFEWVTCWYNPSRRHSTLGQLSPFQFELQHKHRQGLPANNLLVPAWIFRGQQHSTSPSYSAASPHAMMPAA
jgi:putative transposase